MRMLAIETTAFSGSVALLEAGEVVFAAVLPGEQRSAQALAPAVENAMREVGWAMQPTWSSYFARSKLVLVCTYRL